MLRCIRQVTCLDSVLASLQALRNSHCWCYSLSSQPDVPDFSGEYHSGQGFLSRFHVPSDKQKAHRCSSSPARTALTPDAASRPSTQRHTDVVGVAKQSIVHLMHDDSKRPDTDRMPSVVHWLEHAANAVPHVHSSLSAQSLQGLPLEYCKSMKVFEISWRTSKGLAAEAGATRKCRVFT